MKRILVLSDTHHDISNVCKANEIAGPFDAAIHLGDCTRDADFVSETLALACVSVRGNCDSDYSVPEETIAEYDGVKLLCLHGHRCHDPYILMLKAQEAGCRAVLHGHTHTPYAQLSNGIWIINPGSLSSPRYGSNAGFCVLYIENGEIFVKQFDID